MKKLFNNNPCAKGCYVTEKIGDRSIVIVLCDDVDETIQAFSADDKDMISKSILAFVNSIIRDENGNIGEDKLSIISEGVKELYKEIPIKDSSAIDSIYVYEGESELKRYHSGKLVSYDNKNTNTKKTQLSFMGDAAVEKQAYINGGELENYDPSMTVLDYFLKAVKEYPDEKFYFYFESGKCEEFTYSEIYRLARCMANSMKKMGIKSGDKVIVQCNVRDIIIAFWACTLSNIVFVPMTVPTSLDPENAACQVIYHVYNTIDKPKIIISSEIYKDYCDMAYALGISSENLVSIEEISDNSDDNFEPIDRSVDDIEFIFFTSGSTGMPKGAVQKYSAAAAQVAGCLQMYKYRKNDTYLNWMPLEHPGGILMFHLRSVALASKQIIVNTNYILEKPLRWIELIDKYRVNSTWAPHFAYVLLAELIENSKENYNWDLSCIESMLNGGEMVNAAGANRFLRAFSKFGMKNTVLYPAWGMCETCSGTMYGMHYGESDLGVQYINKNQSSSKVEFSSADDPQTLVITEIGRPIPGIEIRITDNNNNIVSEDVIGRFQIKGIPVTQGYYNNPQVNAESFTDDGWFITGDLGFIHNGEMSITGREKDIIIINGLNYNNVEIEAVIEKNPKVKTSYCGVCSVYDFDSQKDKVIAFIVLESENTDFVKLYHEIINDVYNEIMLPIDVIIPLKAEEVPKTNLGKIQRAKLKKQYENGDYDEFLNDLDLKLKNSHTVPEWMYSWKYVKAYAEKTASHVKTAVIYGNCNERNCINSDLSVFFGNKFSYDEANNKFVIVPDDMEHYIRMIALFKELEIERIICLDTFIDNENNFDVIKNDHLFPFIKLMKSAISEASSVSELVLVTNSIYSINDSEPLNSKCGVFAGYVGCFNSECGNIHAILVDSDEASLSMINEFKFDSADRYYLRDNNVYNNILVTESLDALAQKQTVLKEGGVYCITGGLGGIGFALAKYIINKVNGKLLIIGRTEEDELFGDKFKNLNALRELSQNVIYIDCNCCDENGIFNALEYAEQEFNAPIDGIFHMAGVGNLNEHWLREDENLIASINSYIIEEMYVSKIYGTINLVKYANEHKNVFLAVASSTTSYWGSSTFSAYSSANSFIESYISAESRSNNGIFALSFSSWKDTGMSKGNSFGDIGLKRGFMDILPDQGVISIDLACRSDKPLLYIGLDSNGTSIRPYIDFTNMDKFKTKVYLKQSTDSKVVISNISDIALSENGLPLTEKTPNGPVSKSSHRSVAPEELSRLTGVWKKVLNIDIITAESDFFEDGGNSILAVQLLKEIREEYGIDYEMKTLLKNSSAEKMICSINEKLKSKMVG